jgi:hypothetical protein
MISMKTIFFKNQKLCHSLTSNVLISSQQVLSVSTSIPSESVVIKKFESIPGPKPSLPFIGTGWQYFKYSKLLTIIRFRPNNSKQ